LTPMNELPNHVFQKIIVANMVDHLVLYIVRVKGSQPSE